MNNLSITQKINNNRIEGQKFHQSPMVTNASSMLQHDTVSFGMTQREISTQIFSEIEPLAQNFISHIKSGTDSEAIKIIKGLTHKHFELKNAFALYKAEDGNSLMGLAIKHRPTMASTFLDYVKTLHHSAQEDFALFRNDVGNTHFDVALQEERPELALSFLDFVSGLKNPVRKKFVLSRDNNENNQFNIAVSLGYHDVALRFLDLVKNIGGVTPTKFFALPNKNNLLPLHFVMSSGNNNFIDAFLGFFEEAVSRDVLQARAAIKYAPIVDSEATSPQSQPLGQLLQSGRLILARQNTGAV